MNIKNTKIILSAVIFLSVIGFVKTVGAVGVSLYVSPASLTKTAGTTLSVSVGVNASGSKVCAVEGTLVFSNLFCQSITVADDVMTQSSPTCLNPHFLIGIPNCVTSDKTLLTLSIKAGNDGTASINLTGVDIMGEGTSISNVSVGGNYTITTPVIVQQKESSVVENQPEKIKEIPSAKTTEEPQKSVSQQTEPKPYSASLVDSLKNIIKSPLRVSIILIILDIIFIALFVRWFISRQKKISK